MKYVLLVLSLTFSFASFGLSQVFQAQLNKKLQISGKPCDGQVSTFAFHDGKMKEFRCPLGEWFVWVDHNGRASLPIMAKMKKAKGSDDFNFIPTIPVTSEVRRILRAHQIRINEYAEIEVIRK